ncbi:MAG: hypothetical protein HY735_09735 [Verrucomicrobia bacterium]|nr:hypothetical protein [Verrucomicrobiota bacterium]
MNTPSQPFPPLSPAEKSIAQRRRAYIGAYGFEDRSLGWCSAMAKSHEVISSAFVFRYVHPKGPNRIEELRAALHRIGASKIKNIKYDMLCPQPLEDALPTQLSLDDFDEVVVDLSAMTKLLILLVLCRLEDYRGKVRIVYSEAEEYCPSKADYDPVKGQMAATARFPSRGAEQIVRLRCLSSIRMQGQPVTLVAFASFNEKLVAHILGFISPHRLILINGRPPRQEYAWRERATHDIHRRFCQEYDTDNPLNDKGLLARATSTLNYRETVAELETIYREHGLFERIICAATGSKMQTVGLFFSKIVHPDLQIEYPTPDSYYFKDMTSGVKRVHEVVIDSFAGFLDGLRSNSAAVADPVGADS